MKCLICGRATLQHSDNWWDEMSIDCGGDCAGCVSVAEGLAVYAHCEHHGRDCVVWKHYEGSTDLCNPHVCIEKQDITTLMINNSMKRWEGGEQNEFFDRITATAAGIENGTIVCEDLTGLRDDEFIKRLLG